MTFRDASLWFHRYTGLVMALFLIITSVTGVFLAFHDSLDDWFNRDYLSVEVLPNENPLSITELHNVVQEHYPKAKFSTLTLEDLPNDRAVTFRVDRERGQSKDKPPVDFQMVYVNPYTAEIIGTRNKDEWAWRNTMEKVFWFHRNLLLDDLGTLVLGIVALLWTINCFIGVYLTLPRAVKYKKNPKRKRTSAFKRWLPAWKIRRTKNIFKLSFDAHHALSLWLWVMMFVLAWSSVGFNLHEVYKPVMAVVFPEPKVDVVETESANKQQVVKNNDNTKDQEDNNEENNKEDKNKGGNNKEQQGQGSHLLYISMKQIEDAQAIAQQLAQDKGLTITEYSSVSVDRKSGAQTIRFKTNLDTVGRGSSVTFDAPLKPNTLGKPERHNNPLNSSQNLQVKEVEWGFERSTRDSVSMWLVYLHRGFVWGTPYKIFLALVGLAVTIVSGTGVYMWWRGRKARLKKKARAKC